MNSRVRKWVRTFSGPLRSRFSRWLYRLGQYGPSIDKILKAEGVPRDLIYLAMIESGFNMGAVSHASAAGPWQFTKSTGQMYGLASGNLVDQRYDFVHATRAAAAYLRDLYKIYGNWYLAFAAYNAGPGKVNRAIKRGRSTNYWRLSSSRSRHLLAETKNYVPKILAAMYIVKNYRRYGYTSKSFGKPLQFERVFVPDATDVRVIARCAGTSVKVIQALNPALIAGITPPGQRFAIYIPKGAGEAFQKNYTRIPASKRVSELNYRTGYRETIADIAKKYNISASQLARLNGYKQHQKLSTGTIIKIPAKKSVLLAMAENSGAPSPAGISSLSPGPSGGRARISGVAYIISQDNTAPESTPEPEYELTLPVMVAKNSEFSSKNDLPAVVKTAHDQAAGDANQVKKQKPVKKYHVVKSGETLSTIAAKYRLRTSELKRLNGLKSDRIRPQQKLLVKKTAGSNAGAGPAVTTYTVKANDTLYGIAHRHKVTVAQLKDWNGLKSNIIKLGQKLTIRARPRRIASTNANQTKVIYHYVKSGETLWHLSKKYNVKISEIKEWNNLKGDQLRPKQKLKIITALNANGKTASL